MRFLTSTSHCSNTPLLHPLLQRGRVISKRLSFGKDALAIFHTWFPFSAATIGCSLAIVTILVLGWYVFGLRVVRAVKSCFLALSATWRPDRVLAHCTSPVTSQHSLETCSSNGRLGNLIPHAKTSRRFHWSFPVRYFFESFSTL